LQRASKLSHPNLFHLLPGGRWQLAEMDLGFVSDGTMLGRTWDTSSPERRSRQKRLAKCSGLFSRALKYIHSKGFAHSHIKRFKHHGYRGITSSSLSIRCYRLASRALPTARLTLTTRRRQARHGCRCGRCLVSRHDPGRDSYPASSCFIAGEPSRSDCSAYSFHNLSSTSRDTVCAAIPHSAGPQNRSRTVLTRLPSRFPSRSRTGCCPCGKKDRTRAENVAGHPLYLGGLCKTTFFICSRIFFFRQDPPRVHRSLLAIPDVEGALSRSGAMAAVRPMCINVPTRKVRGGSP